MNRLFALFFLSFLFAFYLSPVFGQLELGNDTFQLNKRQNVRNSVDYVKPESDWGKSRSYTDFDPVLGERFQYVLDSLMAKYYMIGASACIIMPEKGIWKGVYGLSDPATGDSIKPETLF